MKPSLQLRFSQQLTMTPQLQQAIKLLQLSSLELEQQLVEALETNPLLEREEALEDEPEAEAGDGDGQGETRDEAMELDSGEGPEWVLDEPATPREGPAASAQRSDSDGGWGAEDAGSEEDLADHLLWQLNLSRLSARDVAIGAAIIEALDECGYLQATPEDLAASLPPDLEVESDEVEAVRHRIQRFDPVGVASRDLAECLRVQLGLLDPETPALELALQIVDRQLDAVARQDLAALKRALGADRDSVLAAIALVRSLDPRPGRRVGAAAVEYVKPDVIVERIGGRWVARLHDDLRPRIGINSYYAGLIGSATQSDADYLRGQLQEARWLLKSLETRNETLLKVANAILTHQAGFFDHGPHAMKPLVLREIAELIDMHESTVSRVTTRKYMATPRGVFELKYFFSSHVGTHDGGECSATAIQAMIRELIDAEPPDRPLSDAKIASILNEKGIDVARRTVAKYREGMSIAASSQRKRLF